tara:strand:- start:11349 stop:11738 length:390 start_codon:yes stop_codon:yes gene_type:complete
MITEFCMSCGAKYQYSLSKPKFCSSCGQRLGEESAMPDETEVEESQASQQEDDNELPNLSKLEYTINKAGNNFTFGDLISEASREGSKSYTKAPSRPAPSYNKQEDIIKSTMNQCRSSREPEDIGGKEA